MRPLIFTNRPGPEIFYLGGILSNFKSINHNILIRDRDKPRIVYGVLSDFERSDGKWIRVEQLMENIRQISKFLNFTWESLYVGRPFFKDLHTVNRVSIKGKIKRTVNFYKPDCIFCHKDNNQFLYDLFIRDKFLDQYIPLITFGCLYHPNFRFSLNPSHISDKKKALCMYRDLIGNDIGMIDWLIDQTKESGQLVNQNYAECLNIESVDNSIINFI